MISGNAASLLGGSPDSTQPQGTPPPNTAPVPPPSAAAPPAAAPQPGDVQKMSNAAASMNQHVSTLAKIGRVAKGLLTGTNISYVPDPQTGEIKEVQTPEKPGQLFRSILAGALLGGAAGANAPANSGFAGGFSAGGNAVVQNAQQQNQIKRENAQRELSGEQNAQRIKDDETYHHAQIAQWGAENLRADANMNLRGQEFIQNVNDTNNLVATKMADVNAQPATVIVGGQNLIGVNGAGPQLQKYLTEHPDQLHGPEGYVRAWTQKVDMAGLKQDAQGGWVDANGNSVDLSSRTAWMAYDVPKKAMEKNVELSGANLAKAGVPGLDPNKMYSVPITGLMSLAAEKIRDSNRDAEDAFKQDQIDKRQARAQQLKALQDDVKTSQAALDDVVNSALMTDSERKKAISDLADKKLALQQFEQGVQPKGANGNNRGIHMKLPNGQTGFIAPDKLDAFKKANPQAVQIQ